jgi:hypothetical protein
MYYKVMTTLACLGAAVACWQALRLADVRKQQAARRVPDEADARLDARLPALRIEGATFEQAVEELRRRFGANIVVRWNTVMEADREAPVDVDLRDVTLAAALRAVLDQTSTAPPLDYTVRDGIVVVSYVWDIKADLVLRCYNVADFGAGTDELVLVIQKLARPARWRGDMPQWTCERYGDVLVVEHTPEGLRLVERALAELRAARAKSPPAPPSPPPAGRPARPAPG